MFVDRTTKLRWRRRYRNRKRQVEDISQQAEETLEHQFFRRLGKLTNVRRFVAAWILLLVLIAGGLIAQTVALDHYYQGTTPVPGGSYTEGILGGFTNANPMYATGPVDKAVARLVFSGLFKYDSTNHLVGDLAENYKVDDKGTTYTVKLRPHLVWQDGKPLSSDDVLFTYQTIQNPDARSPLYSAWSGIKVSTPDARTIIFVLPNALTAFPYSMTNGIVPKHILADVPTTELRSATFNTVSPVGAGPFKWDTIQIDGGVQPNDRQEEIALSRNTTYHVDPPELDHFVIHTFREEKQMLNAFQQNELTAMAGLNTLPDNLQNKPDIHDYDIPVSGEVMVFFKTDSPVLADQKIRQALVQAVNVTALDQSFGYPVVVANSPLLPNQIGYDKTETQLPFDIAAANKLLDDDGWVKNDKGIRTKDGKTLTFQLFSESTSEYEQVTQQLQKAWKTIGVDAQVNLQTQSDLDGTITGHSYDALLYGISIGVDPDVFAYWDSSQADPHLATRYNFSDYKSAAADKALEAGRTRSDPILRAIKYKPFLEAWKNDAPALALYQPRFLYVTKGTVYNFNPHTINEPTDRYDGVTTWRVRTEKSTL